MRASPCGGWVVRQHTVAGGGGVRLSDGDASSTYSSRTTQAATGDMKVPADHVGSLPLILTLNIRLIIAP